MFYLVRMRRRAYVEGHLRFSDGLEKALRWAGEAATIHVGDTQTVTVSLWLEDLGIPITCASRRSRFYDLPRCVVCCAWLTFPRCSRLSATNRSSWHFPWGVRGFKPGRPIGAANAVYRYRSRDASLRFVGVSCAVS